MTNNDGSKKAEKSLKNGVFIIAISNNVDHVPAIDATEDLEAPADFETAVAATGYGLFNYLLLLVILPGGWTSVFDTTSMSYILPSAECDLHMTLIQKGVLNAIIYAGMISSAFLWGFFADTVGRRSLLLFGYFADAICNFLCSTSQSFYVLLAFKFLSGFIINGPFAINMTYVAEFHGPSHRSRMLLWIGLFFSFANIGLPALAWAIIPQTWSFTFFDGYFVYNSWRIFIFLCGIPGLIAFAALLYFPESPKFLMSQGRNDEALKVFEYMYSMNTGKPPETFPVKALCQEGQKKQIERSASRMSMSAWGKARSGWNQIKPLFSKPHFGNFLLIITIQFGSIIGMNTLRLWLPQLFTLMENFKLNERDPSLGPATLCEMLNLSNDEGNSTVNATETTTTCTVIHVADRVYINSIIIAVTSVLGYVLAGTVINLIGKKKLLLIAFLVPAVCNFGIYWSPSSDVTLALSSLIIALTSISTTTVISFIVDLMPTTLRTMAVSLTMMVGRSGALIGNVVFPILLAAGCLTPFMVLGGFLTMCFLLSIFIPKPTGKLI